MKSEILYDCAIIGGGLAGLTLAIQLSRQNFSVILFEKEQYPFHKVCGEYISMESRHFLEELGLPFKSMHLPIINKLMVTAVDGTVVKEKLPLGGFGISRYALDNILKNIALHSSVYILENCRAEEAVFENNGFTIHTTAGTFKSKICCGSFGKRSNLDIKWKRPFAMSTKNKLNNYVGIKYHIRIDHEPGLIGLHNFSGGYCGISEIEGGNCCICYLTNAQNLKDCGNSIEMLEKKVLSRNPFLKDILEKGEKLHSTPLCISQISFEKKSQVQNNILLVGDAAGMITPLCGNGMSMAMHAGKIAAGFITSYLKGEITREQMEALYTKSWKNKFSKRLRTGRAVQLFFGKDNATRIFLKIMKRFPSIVRTLIRMTHGEKY